MVAIEAKGALTPRQLQLLVALSAVGILLRFAVIDRSYWFDELATLNTVDVPDWKTVLDVTSKDNQPPLYNSTVFAWIHAFGYSEVAVRALSALYGLIALFTPWLARRSLTQSQKLLCFAILCLMPLPIRYAQEARNYSLLFLLSAACLFSYYEIVAARSRRLRPLFHVSLVLLALSHLFGLLLAVSFLAVMFWRERRILPRLGLILYGLALCALILVPLLHGGSGQLVGGNFWITFSAASLSQQLLMVLTPVGIALLAYASILWWRMPGKAAFDPALTTALMPFVLMLAGSIAISFNTPILTDRNLIGLIPAFALLTVWLLQPLLVRGSSVPTLIFMSLLLLQAVALIYSPFLFIQEDFRSIARQSIAADSKVCYVVPDATTSVPYIYSFYVVKLFGRPELAPEELSVSEVPQDLSTRDCRLWADAILQKRGESVLKGLPQFSHCHDVPLGKPGARTGSELLECPR